MRIHSNPLPSSSNEEGGKGEGESRASPCEVSTIFRGLPLVISSNCVVDFSRKFEGFVGFYRSRWRVVDLSSWAIHTQHKYPAMLKGKGTHVPEGLTSRA